MDKEELDLLWFKAMHQAVFTGEVFVRYRFAALVADAMLDRPRRRRSPLRRDAERYRWLRDQTTHDGCVISMKNKHIDDEIGYAENIDRFVDAAMKEAALRREEQK